METKERDAVIAWENGYKIFKKQLRFQKNRMRSRKGGTDEIRTVYAASGISVSGA